MDVFLLLVLAAAFVGLIWHGLRWAIKADRRGKHRRRRAKKDPATDDAFFDIIRPIWKHPK